MLKKCNLMNAGNLGAGMDIIFNSHSSIDIDVLKMFGVYELYKHCKSLKTVRYVTIPVC